VPHPPPQPPSASTPRTPRLQRTHTRANTAASQSAADDVNSTSVICGQEQIADRENDSRRSSVTKERDAAKITANCHTTSVKCSQLQSSSSSSVQNNAVGSTNSRMHRSVTSGEDSRTFGQQKTRTYKDATESVTAVHGGNQDLTTSHSERARSKSRIRNAAPARLDSKVMFGKMRAFYLTN